MGGSIWRGCWRKTRLKRLQSEIHKNSASTMPGDPFGGPAKVEKVIMIRRNSTGQKLKCSESEKLVKTGLL